MPALIVALSGLSQERSERPRLSKPGNQKLLCSPCLSTTSFVDKASRWTEAAVWEQSAKCRDCASGSEARGSAPGATTSGARKASNTALGGIEACDSEPSRRFGARTAQACHARKRGRACVQDRSSACA